MRGTRHANAAAMAPLAAAPIPATLPAQDALGPLGKPGPLCEAVSGGGLAAQVAPDACTSASQCLPCDCDIAELGFFSSLLLGSPLILYAGAAPARGRDWSADRVAPASVVRARGADSGSAASPQAAQLTAAAPAVTPAAVTPAAVSPVALPSTLDSATTSPVAVVPAASAVLVAAVPAPASCSSRHVDNAVPRRRRCLTLSAAMRWWQLAQRRLRVRIRNIARRTNLTGRRKQPVLPVASEWSRRDLRSGTARSHHWRRRAAIGSCLTPQNSSQPRPAVPAVAVCDSNVSRPDDTECWCALTLLERRLCEGEEIHRSVRGATVLSDDASLRVPTSVAGGCWAWQH